MILKEFRLCAICDSPSIKRSGSLMSSFDTICSCFKVVIYEMYCNSFPENGHDSNLNFVSVFIFAKF